MKTNYFISSKLLVFLALLLWKTLALAQAPVISWQQSLGGSGEDWANSIQQTPDRGYIVAGFSKSNDGDVTGNHGNKDCWIVKLDGNGTITWQKSLGGSELDGASSIQPTADGGYIVAGYNSSNDGDVTGNHGFMDYWIVKLDGNGNITWQKSLGGSESEYAHSIQQTVDGGYIVAGYSNSTNGDVTGNHGIHDYWIVKLDGNGNISWQKSLGGTAEDIAYSIQQTADSGYIVAGHSGSTNGDVTGSNGPMDQWIIKLDGNGNISWKKCFGGSVYDKAYSIQQTTDGGYIIAGFTNSNNGDVTGNNGVQDSWIVKLDGSGNISWQKCIGGSVAEVAYSIQQTTDGGYIVVSSSSSNDGDVTGNHGSYDYWAVKLDGNGTISWQKSLGGSGSDVPLSVQQADDGGYILAGYSFSNDADVTGNHGDKDYWIVKLAATTAISPNTLWEGLSLYPNPNKGDFLLTGIKEEDYPLNISILDASGRKVHHHSYTSPLAVLPLHLQVASGLYFLQIQNEKGIGFQKFVVE